MIIVRLEILGFVVCRDTRLWVVNCRKFMQNVYWQMVSGKICDVCDCCFNYIFIFVVVAVLVVV
jgi:hypothetical protein